MGFQHLNRASRQDRQDAVCHPSAFGTPAAFKLANDGHATRSLQHYLGHKNIQTTMRYVETDLDTVKRELVEARRRKR